MAFEYIPWLVGGAVATSAIAACTAVCTLHYTCKGKNDSSKDKAKYLKEHITKQHVKDGVILTDTNDILKIYAATNDSQTTLTNALEHKDSEVAKAIVNKDVAPLTVAGLMSTVNSGLNSVSNFFSSNKGINISGQNVVVSDNTLNLDPSLIQNIPGNGYEVDVGNVNSEIVYEVEELDQQQGQGNYLNMLEDSAQVNNSGGNNQLIESVVYELELNGNEVETKNE